MSERLVSVENKGDYTEEHYLSDDGKLIIRRTQDVQPILDRNKALNTHENKSTFGRDFVEVADIPMTVWHDWCTTYGVSVMHGQEGRKILRRLLNSPEYAYLRTGGGRL